MTLCQFGIRNGAGGESADQRRGRASEPGGSDLTLAFKINLRLGDGR